MPALRKATAAPGEVLVAVGAAGLCSAGLHIAERTAGDERMTAAMPVTIGHDFAGVIATPGEGVTGWAAGQRVGCGHERFPGAVERRAARPCRRIRGLARHRAHAGAPGQPPGFLSAHRYRAEQGTDFFTLYQLESLAALETPDYAALMTQPTRWSARMRPHLTGFRRLPARGLLERRSSQGGAMALLRLDRPPAEARPLLAELEALLMAGALTGAVAGGSEAPGAPYAVFPGAPPPGVETLVLLEATEPAPLAALAARLAEAWGAGPPSHWRLLQSLQRAALPVPAGPRQPPRDDLFRHWSG
jgi:hypothetical protein